MHSQDERWILEKYHGEKTEGFFADMERLRTGEPLAFILGHVPFLKATVYLDSRPLIPRVETEFWVAQAIATIKSSSINVPRILDLCAGSGCIGVAVAKDVPAATVHFAEIDQTHHQTIQKNIKENNIGEGRTAVFGGDLFEQTQGPYDFVLCNPPYIPDGSVHVARSVKEYEPPLALYGGEDGFDIIARIIAQSPRYVAKAGILFIEHEPQQEEKIHTHAHALGLHSSTHKDQYGVSRYSVISMAQ